MSTSVNSLGVASSTSTWPADLRDFEPSFPSFSVDLFERTKQLDAIYELKKKYGDKLTKHRFTWEKYRTGRVNSEWLPIYEYKSNLSISEIWEEFANGLDGKLSIRQLEEGWQARWRRNINKLKTEKSRRTKITNLIEELSKKTNWNTELALRYLQLNYPIVSGPSSPPHLQTTRAFMDYLQKTGTGVNAYNAIVNAASNFST